MTPMVRRPWILDFAIEEEKSYCSNKLDVFLFLQTNTID